MKKQFILTLPEGCVTVGTAGKNIVTFETDHDMYSQLFLPVVEKSIETESKYYNPKFGRVYNHIDCEVYINENRWATGFHLVYCSIKTCECHVVNYNCNVVMHPKVRIRAFSKNNPPPIDTLVLLPKLKSINKIKYFVEWGDVDHIIYVSEQPHYVKDREVVKCTWFKFIGFPESDFEDYE